MNKLTGMSRKWGMGELTISFAVAFAFGIAVCATAKRMLKSGMLALKDVARYSGLTLAQVKKLQASMA